MITLYQFPISHYCEKVRWTLDYKGLDYRSVTLLPGLHALRTQRLAPRSSVPLIKFRGDIIQGSENIISTLDREFPKTPLTPSSAALAKEALAWERFADKEIGPHVRRIVYHYLLKHPEIVKPFFAHDGPWYSHIYLNASYKKLIQFMRKAMKIDDEHAVKSHHILDKSIRTISDHMNGRDYMVGSNFTRADIAICSLLAPLVLPNGYGIDWPARADLPSDFASLLDTYTHSLSFVSRHYQDNRNTVNA